MPRSSKAYFIQRHRKPHVPKVYDKDASTGTARAAAALSFYHDQSKAMAVSTLMVDLMAYCRTQNVSFDDALREAIARFNNRRILGDRQ